MRSMSVIIFSAADICRRSRATGCCCKRSFRHMDSIVRSLLVYLRVQRGDLWPRVLSSSVSAFEDSFITSSHSAPISIQLSVQKRKLLVKTASHL